MLLFILSFCRFYFFNITFGSMASAITCLYFPQCVLQFSSQAHVASGKLFTGLRIYLLEAARLMHLHTVLFCGKAVFPKMSPVKNSLSPVNGCFLRSRCFGGVMWTAQCPLPLSCCLSYCYGNSTPSSPACC